MSTGWETRTGDFPWPPANVQVVSPLFTGAMDVRWDDPSLLNTGRTQSLVAATALVTLTDEPVIWEAANGTLTIVTAPVPVGAMVTVDTVILVSVAGAPVPGSDTFDGSGTATQIATSLAAAINTGSLALAGTVGATSSGALVTVGAQAVGAAGNDIVLLSSNNHLVAGSSTLLGGVDGDTLSVGISVFYAMPSRNSGEYDFAVGPTLTDTALSLAAAINDPNNRTSFVTAVAGVSDVTIRASTLGEDGNSILLSTTSNGITLSGTSLADGAGDPKSCLGQSNAQWQVVGVNVYRSDNGERGPYIRVNRFPIGSMFYRDSTDNILIRDEVVQWDGAWVSKGDASNDRKWAFRTIFSPIVRPNETPVRGLSNKMVAVPANSPADVVLKIDGVQIPVEDVFGPNGEIRLINQDAYDLAREKTIPAVLPGVQSEVTITYWYNRNLIKTDLDRTTQAFYRVTTVALDPSSPSGYTETPLAYSPPVSVAQVETLDYIWREAIRRNLWILQQGGERVKLFKKKVSGIPCPCRMDERTLEYAQQPSNRCHTCLGCGFVGGFDGPIDIIVAPDDAERRISQSPNGRRMEHSYEVWCGPSPSITQRDFILKQTGERYSIGPVHRPASRGLPLQQHFTIAYLDEQDIRYRMPVDGITELPWPETRLTPPVEAPCDPGPPFPVGFDSQVSPMETDAPKIPAERQLRGRSPVWGSITYGGKNS